MLQTFELPFFSFVAKQPEKFMIVDHLCWKGQQKTPRSLLSIERPRSRAGRVSGQGGVGGMRGSSCGR